jgi:KUP system potassium uptake protein
MNVFLKKVVEELMESGELNISPKYHLSRNELPTGDFKFVIIQEFLSHENDLPVFDQIVMSLYLFIKKFTASPQNWFGLDSDSVALEKVPLVLKRIEDVKLKRLS